MGNPLPNPLLDHPCTVCGKNWFTRAKNAKYCSLLCAANDNTIFGKPNECWQGKVKSITIANVCYSFPQLVYIANFGPLPKDARIQRECITPGCINPEHLRIKHKYGPPIRPPKTIRRAKYAICPHCNGFGLIRINQNYSGT